MTPGRIKKGHAVGTQENLPGCLGHWKEEGRAVESVKRGDKKLLDNEVGQQESSIMVPVIS